LFYTVNIAFKGIEEKRGIVSDVFEIPSRKKQLWPLAITAINGISDNSP